MRTLQLVASTTNAPRELFMVSSVPKCGAAQLLDKDLPCQQIWVYGFQSILAVDSQGYNRALRLVRSLTLKHLPQHAKVFGFTLITKRFGGKLLRCAYE